MQASEKNRKVSICTAPGSAYLCPSRARAQWALNGTGNTLAEFGAKTVSSPFFRKEAKDHCIIGNHSVAMVTRNDAIPDGNLLPDEASWETLVVQRDGSTRA